MVLCLMSLVIILFLVLIFRFSGVILSSRMFFILFLRMLVCRVVFIVIILLGLMFLLGFLLLVSFLIRLVIVGIWVELFMSIM